MTEGEATATFGVYKTGLAWRCRCNKSTSVNRVNDNYQIAAICNLHSIGMELDHSIHTATKYLGAARPLCPSKMNSHKSRCWRVQFDGKRNHQTSSHIWKNYLLRVVPLVFHPTTDVSQNGPMSSTCGRGERVTHLGMNEAREARRRVSVSD